MKTHYKFNGAHGNELRILVSDYAPEGVFVVHDSDAQMERAYKIGVPGELENGCDPVPITSMRQVKDAWGSGKIWF